MRINHQLKPKDLSKKIASLFQAAAPKILGIEKRFKPGAGAPVFTVRGKYTARGWTEWTQGFQYGSALLQFDATGDKQFLKIGRDRTREAMASHVTHTGVHDHGFNNVSTYGNLLRLMNEGRIPENAGERDFYGMALKASGAVQAARWTAISENEGYIYSFNGPQSLFVDTIRTVRALALAHGLGHILMGEKDRRFSLLHRLVQHAQTTARYNIFYGKGRDAYDVRGRTAHESLFNVNDGSYRCPSSQQGYSPFTTWTRGLAWAMVGYAEELEYLATLDEAELKPLGGRRTVEQMLLGAALATSDFYIENTPVDGIPYWDTGAPDLHKLGDYLNRPADPFNDFEPVDSSAAAIAAQGLLRLGIYLKKNSAHPSEKYWQAGLTVLDTLFDEPYLSPNPRHEGLILHSVYHRPNGWDPVPRGQSVPNGESSMWGDYHALEAALYLKRIIDRKPYYTFFGAL